MGEQIALLIRGFNVGSPVILASWCGKDKTLGEIEQLFRTSVPSMQVYDVIVMGSVTQKRECNQQFVDSNQWLGSTSVTKVS